MQISQVQLWRVRCSQDDRLKTVGPFRLGELSEELSRVRGRCTAADGVEVMDKDWVRLTVDLLEHKSSWKRLLPAASLEGKVEGLRVVGDRWQLEEVASSVGMTA